MAKNMKFNNEIVASENIANYKFERPYIDYYSDMHKHGYIKSSNEAQFDLVYKDIEFFLYIYNKIDKLKRSSVELKVLQIKLKLLCERMENIIGLYEEKPYKGEVIRTNLRYIGMIMHKCITYFGDDICSSCVDNYMDELFRNGFNSEGMEYLDAIKMYTDELKEAYYYRDEFYSEDMIFESSDSIKIIINEIDYEISMINGFIKSNKTR